MVDLSAFTDCDGLIVGGGQWLLFAATHAVATFTGAVAMFIRCCLRCDRRHHVEDEPLDRAA